MLAYAEIFNLCQTGTYYKEDTNDRPAVTNSVIK